MVKVTVYRGKNQEVEGFCCRGHSGFAARGRDIVCAGVSVLVLNTVNSLRRFTDDAFDLDTDEKSGLIRLKFRKPPSKEAKLLTDSMILGLEGIISSYGGKYVTLEFKEV